MSGSHPERRTAGRAQWCRQISEIAQQLPCIAGVDDLLDPEGLGGAVGGAQTVQPQLDFVQLRGRVRRGVDVSTIGSLDTAFQRQRSPTRGGPGIAQTQMTDRLVPEAADAVAVAHYNAAPRHGGLINGGQRANAPADDGGALGSQANLEPG